MYVMRKVVVLLLVMLTACGADGPETVATLAPVPAEYAGAKNPLGADAAIEGAEVFKSHCQACHGPQGRGDGPAGEVLDPQPKDLAELQAVAGDDYLYWRINSGKQGTAMVAWEGVLTDEQIWQAVAFIRTLK